MIKKIGLLFFAIITLNIISTEVVLAGLGTIGGKVIVVNEAEGMTTELPVPGVIIAREDTCNPDSYPSCRDGDGHVSSWGNNIGVFSVTQNDGKYLFKISDNGPGYDVGYGSVYCNNPFCATLRIGSNVSTASCSPSYHCGMSCRENQGAPHRWLAYFSPDFDKSVFNDMAGVYFDSNNMKGGGSWNVLNPGINNYGSDQGVVVWPGNEDWVVDAANYGSTTYASNEWYRLLKVHNNQWLENFDIQWVPGSEPSFACADLISDPSEDSLGVGDTTVFTCKHSIEEYTFSHYNYQIKEPGDDTWNPKAEWQDLPGATPAYTIPSSGAYTVQCQACREPVEGETDPVCTSWGQATTN